ncbi:MAG: hypothetical protein KKA64_00420 [Nanoarchaeota archaeon]|nr:hypothetical protein [Nanoarchaeota archaeon]
MPNDTLASNYFTCINPEESYDRKTFVDKFGDLSDLEEYIETMQKEPNNPSVLSDLSTLLHGDDQFYSELTNPLSVASGEADRAYTYGIDAIAKYVKKNLNDFFGKTDEKDALKLVSNLPLYKTGNEEHDKFVKLSDEIKEISAASQDAQKMQNYTVKQIKSLPEWLQESFAYFGNRQDYASALFKEFASHTQRKFNKAVSTEEREINKNKLERIIKDSLRKAHEEQDKEPNKKDKYDIWKKAIRPYYLVLAKLVHPKEKKKEKLSNSFEREREERKAERRELGMAA